MKEQMANMKRGNKLMEQLRVITVMALSSFLAAGLVGCSTYGPTSGYSEVPMAPQQVDQPSQGAPDMASHGQCRWHGPVLAPGSRFQTAPTPLSLGFEIGLGNTIESLGPVTADETGRVTGTVVESNRKSRVVLLEPDEGSTFIAFPSIRARLLPATSSAQRNLLRFRIADTPPVDWSLLKPGARVALDCRELANHCIEATKLTAL